MPKIVIPVSYPPHTNFFGIVREVVESQIAATIRRTGATRAQVCEGILEHYKRMSSQWTCNKKPQIAYDDPVCRIAYLYGIAPAFANLIDFVLRQDSELADHFVGAQRDRGEVSICAFGGGPGTELLGIAKWVERKAKPGEQFCVDYLLLDKVSEWVESWEAIRNAIEGIFRKYVSKERKYWPLLLSGQFSSIDITDTSRFGNLGALFERDIFILSYVVSEVFSDVKELSEFASKVAGNAPLGSKFLFIDRAGDCWKNDVKKLARTAGLELSPFHETSRNMDPSEKSNALGGLIGDIGRNPKVTWNAFWAVGTKV